MCTARTKPRHGSGSPPLISNISPTFGSERLSGSGKTITFRWMLHEGKILSMQDGESSVPLLHWSITLSEPCITGWERSPCLLAGRFPLLSTTRQVSLQLVFSVQLAFHAFFTLTIVTMASFRSRLKKENTVPWPQQMNAILQLLSLSFS